MDILSLASYPQAPNQPTSFSFPRRSFGKKKIVYRSCHTCWFNSWTWLHYDEDKDVVLCFLCWKAYWEKKLSSRVGSSDDAFISRGFCNWKDATIAFRQHERSKCHRIAIEKLSILSDSTPVLQEIISRSPFLTERMNNQHCLVKVLGSLRYLAKQGCGLRKSDDSAGYLYQLLKFTSEGDPQLRQWLNNETLTEHFLSNESQNKLLNLMSNCVIKRTATEIQNTEFCTIMMEECTNAANEDQIVVALRWVGNDLLVHENFIGLFDLSSIDDSSLFTQVRDTFIHFDISLTNVRGWCYNGSNITSKTTRDAFNSVMHNEQPLAFYMHCYGHSLNLAASDAVKHCSTMSNMLSIAHEITKLIKHFPSLFGSIIKDGIIPGTTGIRVLCPTRWTVKAESMLTIIQNYAVLQDMWDVAVDMSRSSETIACIRGVAGQMKTFDFFFSLFLGETLLRYTDNLSRTLQKQSFTALDKMKVAEQTKQALANIRNDFDMFWAKVNSMLSEVDVSNPVTKESEKENSSKNHDPKHHYRQVYHKALDNLILTIEDRFDQLGYSMFCFLEMLFLKVFHNEDYCDALEKVNEIYASDFDLYQLRTQLDVLNSSIPDNVNNIFDIQKYFQQLSLAERELISEVIKLLKLMFVLPATNSISESSFSTMHRVKSYLQSTISQERLSSVMLLHAHNDYTDDLDLVAIANSFINK